MKIEILLPPIFFFFQIYFLAINVGKCIGYMEYKSADDAAIW